jgi:hypothetical protein
MRAQVTWDGGEVGGGDWPPLCVPTRVTQTLSIEGCTALVKAGFSSLCALSTSVMHCSTRSETVLGLRLRLQDLAYVQVWPRQSCCPFSFFAARVPGCVNLFCLCSEQCSQLC